MRTWEVPSMKANSFSQPFDVGVMMGGAMRYYNSDMERVVYGSGADRLMQCIDLYKKGKIRKILISGGSGLLTDQRFKEADLLRNVLISTNIPSGDIYIENLSKNTYENALFSAAILKKDFPGQKILLITSAYHMRRSMACFEKQGITVTPFSVDEQSGRGQYTPDKLIIPDVFYLEGWDKLIHEWIGYVSYKIAGYV